MKNTFDAIQLSIDELWQKYFTDKNTENRNLLVLRYLPLVRFTVHRMNLPKHSIFSHEDVQNIGILGLIEAIERYDPNLGTKFETFAVLRIRGRIIDEIRRIDWLSRNARKKAQVMEETMYTLQSFKSGDRPSFAELFEKMNVSEEEFKKFVASYEAAKSSIFFNESQLVNVDGEEVPLIDNFPDNDAVDLLEQIIEEEKIKVILDFLESLPERNRLIMVLYYYENLKFREIAQILEISESRVSQIHSQIISSLKKKFIELEE